MGASWGVLGASWGCLGTVLGRLGGVFGRLWASWSRLGASWGGLGSVLGRLGDVLGTSWGLAAGNHEKNSAFDSENAPPGPEKSSPRCRESTIFQKSHFEVDLDFYFDFGVILPPFWHPKSILGRLGASWGVLGASWAVLGASWRRLGASWGRLGRVSGRLSLRFPSAFPPLSLRFSSAFVKLRSGFCAQLGAPPRQIYTGSSA